VVLRYWLGAYSGSEYTGDYNELVYLRARFYAPEMGRFLTRDLWEGDANSPLSLNHWEYAYEDPIGFTDPSGLLPCPWNIHSNACDINDYIAWLFGNVYHSAGINTDLYVPTKSGSVNFAGAVTNQYLQDVRPLATTYNQIADIGLNAMPGGSSVYNAYNAISGTNPFSGYGYSPQQRYLGLAFAGLGGISECLGPVLPAGKYINSRSGEIVSTVLTEDTTFYRIWGGSTVREGSWLSAIRPATQSEAIYGLALEPGNTAQFVSEVVVPAGTRVQYSIAKAIPTWDRLGGGLMQVELLEYIPPGNYGPGLPLPVGLLP
jgi:RHS repeat-associated protein